MAHTPGPWSVFGDPEDFPGIDSFDLSIVLYGTPSEHQVGVQGRSEDEKWANAHLIAAAPDLLEALKAARSHLVSITGGDTSIVPQSDQDLIDAALAKAEGRTDD